MLKQTLALTLICVGLLAQASQPIASGEARQSLDGTWQFSTNTADEAWGPITVPGNWDTLDAYSTYVGKGWYRRAFAMPADWKGRRIRLCFGAVYHDAVVTLNGKELGSHSGGYTPFEFDVTDALDYAGENRLLVCADNSYQRGAWWHWGGISRSVALVANHDVRIVRQHITALPDLKTGTASLSANCLLANAGDTPREVTVTVQVDGQQLAKVVKLPASTNLSVTIATTLKNVRLWHFDHPELYTLATRVQADGRVLHERQDRFGVRRIELTTDSLLLNGERVRLCGYNRVSDSRRFGNTEPDELVRLDVDLMKRANGNLTRLMHVAQAPNLLDYLDEKGMLIWCEIPVWGGDDPQVKNPDNPLTRQWMAEMIERDYNHPCIIGWSVGNELMNHYRYVENMAAYTRTLDPHRIVTHASYTGARGNCKPETDPITIAPIILYNTYNKNQDTSAILGKRWPDKPIFYSEFGISQFGAKPESRIAGIEEMFARLTRNHPAVVGGSLWTYNDYRSNYKGTPASGNREWGIVDEARRPKAAYDQLRRLFRPVKSLACAEGRIILEPRSPNDVPSYTLQGYTVVWTRFDAAGRKIDTGTLAVPTLKPGAPTWNTALPTSAQTAATVTLALMTPTGYDVCDWTGTP